MPSVYQNQNITSPKFAATKKGLVIKIYIHLTMAAAHQQHLAHALNVAFHFMVDVRFDFPFFWIHDETDLLVVGIRGYEFCADRCVN